MNTSPQDVTPRTKLALVRIYQHMQAHPYHYPPSHRELLAELNQCLPPRNSEPGAVLQPCLISTEQTHRAAEELRGAGLLDSAPGMQLNMQPTAEGRRYARAWAAETERWLDQEWSRWENLSGETRRSVQRSRRLAEKPLRKATLATPSQA